MTDLAGVGTRLYDSTVRAELYGYAANNVALGLRHRQPFVHNLRVSATVPYAPTKLRIWDKTEHCVTIGLLPFVSRLSCWAWNHAGIYTCMHMASRTRIVAAVSKYGEHAWDNVIISWRHNFIFHVHEMFNVPWTLKIVSFPKFVMAIQLWLTR